MMIRHIQRFCYPRGFPEPMWRCKEMTDYINMHLYRYMSVRVLLSRVFAFSSTILLVVFNVIKLKF